MHFLLLGAALYAVRGLGWSDGDPRPEPVVVEAATVEALRDEWRRTTGRTPHPEELEQLVQDHVDRELLLREALARGLHRTDAVVQRRLLQNQRFVDDAGVTDEERLERAYALGLERTDLVVRRRLVERMRRIIWAGAGVDPVRPGPPPVSGEPVLSGRQLFVSAGRRDGRLADEALRLRARLVTEGLGPDDPTLDELGDPLLLPAELPPSTPSQLTARFGRGFGEAVAALPIAVWSEPIPSSYGLHLVWLRERRPAPPQREPATDRNLRTADRRRASLEEALQILRRNVDVIRHDRPVPR